MSVNHPDTDTTSNDDAPVTAEDSDFRTGGLTVNDAHITDTLVGIRHENYDGVTRGCYPKNLDPEEFVGTLRRFTGKHIQYLYVVGDLNGHAVYRMVNETNPSYELHTRPWDRFIEKTAHVTPDAPGAQPDDPARTVVRTDFDTLRKRRESEIETGCTCLEDEACSECA